MDHFISVLDGNARPEHGEELGVLDLRVEVEAGVQPLDLFGLAVPLLELLLRPLVVLPLALLAQKRLVLPLELLELLVLLNGHPRLLGGLGPVCVIVFDGLGQLAHVAVADLVALHQHINDRLILAHLLLQVSGLPEAPVDDALGLLGVDVLVLTVHKVLESPAFGLQSIGRGARVRFVVAPGVGGPLLSLRVSALASLRRFGLLPEDDILVFARFSPPGGCGGCLGLALCAGCSVARGRRPCACSACGTTAVEQVQPDVQQMLEVHRIASFFVAGVSPPCIGP